MISDKMVEAAFRSEMPDALSRVISRRHIRALLTAALSAASCNCPGEGRPAASGVDTSTNEAWAARAQEKIEAMDAASGGEDDMCPNCVTPWKCNGPHESTGGASVSERARALMAQAYRDGGYPHAAGTLEAGVIDSVDACALSAIEKALTQQRGECEDARKFRRLAQLLDGFDFRLGRNVLMPPATYLDSVEITCEFQPGIGQSVIDAIVDVLATEKRND